MSARVAMAGLLAGPIAILLGVPAAAAQDAPVTLGRAQDLAVVSDARYGQSALFDSETTKFWLSGVEGSRRLASETSESDKPAMAASGIQLAPTTGTERGRGRLRARAVRERGTRKSGGLCPFVRGTPSMMSNNLSTEVGTSRCN